MLSDPRVLLERLCEEWGEDFAGPSRMLGRNPAYIQQFVRRGVPRRLKEAERRKLASYFAIPESLLGGPTDPSPTPPACFRSSAARSGSRPARAPFRGPRRASPISPSTSAG